MKTTLIHHFLERQCRHRPDAVLVVDGRRQATYAEVEGAANRIAHALLIQGIQPGDRVGLLAVNSIEYIISYYGILKSGGTVVALNASASWRTHCELLQHSKATALIWGPRVGRRAEGIDRLPHLELIIGWPDARRDHLALLARCRFMEWPDVVQTMADTPPNIALQPTDRAAIVYTSGSTGQQKGVMLRHGNVVANTQSIVQYLELAATDRVLVVLPFHYVYGKSLLNTHVAVGGSVAIENGFRFPQKALDTLERTRATGLSGVPSTFAILLNRSNFAARSLPHLRYVTQAGGHMAVQLQRRLLEALPGKRIFIMYGATEASARLSYFDLARTPSKAGSVGKAIPGVRLRVLDDAGNEVPIGEIGELVATGPNIMEGYWNAAVETAAVLDDNGYHTGDLGKRDGDGFLFVVGRKREMIKSGAHRIAPKEIEDVLSDSGAVQEAAVVGIPDEMLGEALVAFVTAKPKQKIDPRQVIRWCKTLLPPHKIPRELHVLCDLPRNGSGKIDKCVLRRRARNGHTAYCRGAR